MAKLAKCSFCSKDSTIVQKLIEAPKANICNECISKCLEIISDQPVAEAEENASPSSLMHPVDIKEFLDEYVIGQDSAKSDISIAVYNHMQRIANPEMELPKSNIMMIGPSGSGKTLIADTVAKILNVPFITIDCNSLTSSGYVGDDVDTILTKLYQAAGGDVEKAQNGIVFLDEIDKKQKKSNSSNVGKDISGEAVQQALLKIIEGTELYIPKTLDKMSDVVKINTKNILFIAGGAFVDLEKQIKNTQLGFAPVNTSIKDIDTDALINYGLIPEFVGRFSVLAVLDKLDAKSLSDIMTKSKNSVAIQYKNLFKLSGIDLDITSTGVESIVQECLQKKTGARGLRTEMEKRLKVHQYNIKKLIDDGITTIKIDKDTVAIKKEVC